MDMRDFFYFMTDIPANGVQVMILGMHIDHKKLARGEYTGIDLPVVCKREYGKKYYDILGTGYTSLYLISNRIKKLLEDNQCTGWKVFPIKLYDKSGEEVPGYWGLSFCGHCGPTFFKTADIIEKREVPGGPFYKYYKGFYIDKWDGSDFFMPETTLHTFVSKKVVDVFTNEKIKYIYFKSFAEAEVDTTLIKPSEIRDESG